MLYPWLTETYQSLEHAAEQQRLPHALLLMGPQGLGKQKMALLFSQRLHCQSPSSGLPCQQCEACRLFMAGSHPDHLLVAPQEQGKAILIDQVRDIVDFSHHTANQGGYRTVVIAPADRMNWNAQNAVLKTLEEPGQKTLLILVAEQLSQLLPTVVSRCQQRILPVPDFAEGLAWLESQNVKGEEAKGLFLSARGAPLQALALQDKPWFQERGTLFNEIINIQRNAAQLPQLAKKLSEFEGQEFLPALYHWLAQGIKAQQGALVVQDEALILGINALKQLQPQRLFAFQEAVLRALKLWISSANPNKEMLYEQLLMVLLGVPLARDVVQAY